MTPPVFVYAFSRIVFSHVIRDAIDGRTGLCKRLQEGRFAGLILTNEDSDGGIDRHLAAVSYRFEVLHSGLFKKHDRSPRNLARGSASKEAFYKQMCAPTIGGCFLTSRV